MKAFDQIVLISALPVIDIESISRPQNGWLRSLSSTCQKQLNSGTKCYEFYASLQGSTVPKGIHLCPFGFSTLKFSVGNSEVGITGFIPTPRSGHQKEKIIAKRHPEYKYQLESVENMTLKLQKVRRSMETVEIETIKNQSMALHELRKLNRIVVQTAERVCNEQSPGNPENASKQNVTIWKAATLMSEQFEIIEIVANESLTDSPLNQMIVPYPLFDKCVRIYQTLVQGKHNIRISGLGNHASSPRIYINDKTFPIIPTVLIENALKYATPKSDIRINFQLSGKAYLITVANESIDSTPLNNRIFERGVRLTTKGDGSGHGLYLAKLIAAQHNAKLTAISKDMGGDKYEHYFTLSIPIASPFGA